MTAPVDHSKLIDFEGALESASTWRGECIQQFADLQLVIEDALQSLAKAKPSMKVRLGQPVLPEIDELKRLVGGKSAFGPPSHAVAKSLDEIDLLIDWRAHLTHGVLEIWHGRKGKLLFTFQHREPGGSSLRMHAIAKDEADQMLVWLTKEVRDLKSRVGLLRASLNPKTA
jgi:hypothetical protein